MTQLELPALLLAREQLVSRLQSEGQPRLVVWLAAALGYTPQNILAILEHVPDAWWQIEKKVIDGQWCLQLRECGEKGYITDARDPWIFNDFALRSIPSQYGASEVEAYTKSHGGLPPGWEADRV